MFSRFVAKVCFKNQCAKFEIGAVFLVAILFLSSG